MAKITFKTDKDSAETYGNTTVTGGGYVRMSTDDFAKYAYPSADVPTPGEGVGWEPTGWEPTGSGTGNTAAVPGWASGGSVAARDYVAGKGYSGVVDWDGESVLIGGFAVAPSFVKDGTAYVPQSAADYAVKRLEESNGIKKSPDIESAVDKKYGSKIEDALNAILDRKDFSYDPDTDPVFAAYKSMYEREGENAYRRVLNDNNTSVTGASGAVLSEAMAARNDYMTGVTDIIPELAEDAYKRYTGEGDRLSDNLKSLTGLASDYYDRLYSASRDSYNDVIKAGKAERSEKQRQAGNARADAQLELSREQNRINNERNLTNDAYKNALNELEMRKENIELEYYPKMLESQILSNNLKSSSTALNNAFMRGFFTAEDEAALPWLSEYRTDTGYSVNPLLTQAAYEYQKEYNKKRADINAVMGW